MTNTRKVSAKLICPVHRAQEYLSKDIGNFGVKLDEILPAEKVKKILHTWPLKKDGTPDIPILFKNIRPSDINPLLKALATATARG